ncbi:MAG: DUF4143 domain-containing protein, partial [Anaerovoracaceae bacterium]
AYLTGLTESFIIYQAKRFDIKGKQYLKTNEKYYLCDIGLRNFLLGSKVRDRGRVLENVIYLELLRRGYDVYVGKFDKLEVDFVAQKGGTTEYFQVSETIIQEETYARELKVFTAIKDNNPKTILTLDPIPKSNEDGIVIENAIDFLLGEW